MARIQIDFDQVMLFGDLHRDISTSLQGHKAAFQNTPGVRLDQIIEAALTLPQGDDIRAQILEGRAELDEGSVVRLTRPPAVRSGGAVLRPQR